MLHLRTTMSDTIDCATKLEFDHRANMASPFNFSASTVKSEASSGYASSSSPQSTSPPHTLKRSKSSSFRLINRRISTISNCSSVSIPAESPDRLTSMIGWYPAFLVKIYFELLFSFFVVLLKHLPLMIPTLWVSACLWLFWKSVTFPFAVARYILLVLFVPAAQRQRRKRTVLITGGSTVQSVYLARNFYSAGARVICCDVIGKFQLARFSNSVSKYYTIPPVDDHQIDEYIEAIKSIVLREGVEYFIPVSVANGAYYDALVKTHLELMNCVCICPDVEDVLLLDDLSAVLHHAENASLPTPAYQDVTSYQHLNRLYEAGSIKLEPHLMHSCGVSGCKMRNTYELPRSRRDFHLLYPINEMHPWVVVPKMVSGQRYVTCTTVRGSQVLCNVTCRIAKLDELVPVEVPEIEQWLQRFFAALRPERAVTGHLSFYFVRQPDTGSVVLVDCQVGVRMPYICYTSVQSRLVCKPCRHFVRSRSGPIINNGKKYWLDKLVLDALTHLSPVGLWNLLGAFFVRHDALFVFWDPLPYCAFYYLQLPLGKFYNVVKKYAN